MPLEKPPHKHVTNSRKLPKTLLITGFEAFGDDPSGQGMNPSAQIATALHGKQLGAWQITAAVLPCVFQRAPRKLQQLVKLHAPHAIVCLGQAGGRSAISLERVAINWDEASLADNAGHMRTGQAILKAAPAAYFSTLPIHKLRDTLLAHNMPAELSSSAGHFVCNHVFFHLMHSLKTSKRSIPAGFIHVPYLPEQALAGEPSMTLEKMLESIQMILSALKLPPATSSKHLLS
jgi:pyroglutamyl-peptidase